MNEAKISLGILRAALGGATGGLLFFVYLGLRSDMFQTETGHDQAYLVMYIGYFLVPFLLLGTLTGTIIGICIWLITRPPKNPFRLIKRVVLGMFLAILLAVPITLYFGEDNRTFEYWTNFTVLVLMFGFAVGALAGGFAGTRRAGADAEDRRFDADSPL